MERKQVILQDGEYFCDIDVTVEEWKAILTDETLMFSTYKNALVSFYSEPEHKSTCKALGEKYDKEPQHFNSVITNFAKAVQKKLNRFEVFGTDEKLTYWIIPMLGKHAEGYFEWTLRAELVQAMEELGMTEKSFFTREDFELFERYAGKNKKEFPEAHNLLRNVYYKLGKIIDSLKATKKYKCEIRRNPLNQGGVYERYHWTRIYPIDLYNACFPQIFFVVGLDVDGLNIHIDSYTSKGYNPNETAIKIKDNSYEVIDVDTIIKWSFKTIVSKIENYIDEHLSEFFRFGQEFGIKECINRLKQIEMQEYVQLLESSKNLVFTGAPGTGKTYLAKRIAKQMIGVSTDEELEQSEQFAFVQFHPSYDYTDFVEGLRPTKPDDNGNIGFEIKDGIFKEFCFNALQNLEDSKKDKEELSEEKLLEQKYNTLIDQIQNGEVDKLPLKTPNMYAEVFGISDSGNIIFKKPNAGLPSSNTVSLARLKKLAKEYKTKEELYKISNIDKGIRKIIGGCNTTQFWSVLHYIYDKYGEQTDTQLIEIVKPKNYIFIIDEINRGEISKIFGELFFSIDPGYRGKRGTVKTQYSNMHEDPDEDFYVPENVYIIGTMNDIDRSVESFDFAMRRRFTWKEITAEHSAENMNLPKEIKDKMANLNTKISETDGLNDSYHIGGAYFLDTDGKPRADYETVWEFRLEPLLKEYLRGISEAENKLKDLKNAYNAEINNG